jgi:cytochrome c2
VEPDDSRQCANWSSQVPRPAGVALYRIAQIEIRESHCLIRIVKEKHAAISPCIGEQRPTGIQGQCGKARDRQFSKGGGRNRVSGTTDDSASNNPACHSIDENDLGPKHRGVVGRRAGSLEDYTYSLAVKNSGLTWDKTTLDRWLTNPSDLVPGTKMYLKIDDPQKRADIIAYLERLK